VYRGGPDIDDDGTVIEHSRVIEWQRRTISESYRDYKSVVSIRTSASRPAASEAGSKAPSVVSKAPTEASKAPSVARSVSAPVGVPQTSTSDAGGSAAKQIIGTLLGAAAGAAVAYAFVRSEQDSAKKEADFSALMQAKNTVKAAVGLVAQASSQPQTSMRDPLPIEAAPSAPQSVHRNIDAQSVHSSTPPQARSVYAQRQIEAAPPSYYSPTSISRARTQVAEPLAIEYAPAYSVAPSQARTRLTAAHRSVTSPELLTLEKARSVASTVKPESVVSFSKPKSVAHSVAPSSLISSFVPDHVERRSSAGSVHSHHSSRSKARSSHTHASRHTSHSKHSSRREVEESSPSPPPPGSKAPSKAPSKAASIVSSILGRDAKSSASKHDDFIDDLDIEELTEDDLSTVVPSDSISNAGSRRSHRSHRSHRSKKDAEGSVVSKHSSASKHSKHSHRSHRSHKSRSHASDDSDDDEKSSKHHRSSRPSVFSEPSDASTVKPIKSSSSKHGARKDSLTQGSEYDGLFDEVQYGSGSVAVRGITPSMISAAGKNQNRSMINFSVAQKMRNFEGSQAR
jgi:hypothetical protein